MPVNFPVARGPVHLCGALIEIDESTGRALSIQRINELYEPPQRPAPAPPTPAEAVNPQ
jgi:calcineurin-like phosphoesterase